MIRYLAWLCFWMGAVLSLGSCYTAEDSWKICCRLLIVGDETSSPAERRAIMEWQRLTAFREDGSSVDVSNANLPGATKKQLISSSLADFLAGQPGSRASDYFLGLGMMCRFGIAPKDDVTRCEIDLPITIKCASLNMFFPGGAPVPEELRKPMPALLRVSVDVSAATLIDMSTRIVPVTGGRLCHR